MNTYCGNNASFPGLLNGTHVVGTNHTCLQKGIGVGSHLPYDASYAGPFNPLDQRRIYCGNAAALPAGYDYRGNPTMCLQKGVGLGKAAKARRGRPLGLYFIRYTLPVLLGLLLAGIVFLVLYYTKARFVTKIKDGKRVIDWSKFIPYWILFSIPTSVIIILLWLLVVRRRI